MTSRAVRPIRIEGDVAYVTLTRGYEAIIDAADVPLVEGWNWHAVPEWSTFYARRTDYKNGKKTVQMHRVIINCPDGFEVDHINGDGLNNRRFNLRIATKSQNQSNRGPQVDNKSGIKGVYWCKSKLKWVAGIKLNKVRRALGVFDTPEAAHAAYIAASKKLHGEFGRVL
jgi:hypothetical protein